MEFHWAGRGQRGMSTSTAHVVFPASLESPSFSPHWLACSWHAWSMRRPRAFPAASTREPAQGRWGQEKTAGGQWKAVGRGLCMTTCCVCLHVSPSDDDRGHISISWCFCVLRMWHVYNSNVTYLQLYIRSLSAIKPFIKRREIWCVISRCVVGVPGLALKASDAPRFASAPV